MTVKLREMRDWIKMGREVEINAGDGRTDWRSGIYVSFQYICNTRKYETYVYIVLNIEPLGILYLILVCLYSSVNTGHAEDFCKRTLESMVKLLVRWRFGWSSQGQGGLG